MRKNDILVTKSDGTQAIQQGKRRPVTQSLSRSVFARDGLCCRYCGRKSENVSVYEIDHVKPTSKGGLDELDNLVVACRDCNRKKKDSIWIPLTIEEAWNSRREAKNSARKRKNRSEAEKRRKKQAMRSTHNRYSVRFD